LSATAGRSAASRRAKAAAIAMRAQLIMELLKAGYPYHKL
jgi:hypothetical protein